MLPDADEDVEEPSDSGVVDALELADEVVGEPLARTGVEATAVSAAGVGPTAAAVMRRLGERVRVDDSECWEGGGGDEGE